MANMTPREFCIWLQGYLTDATQVYESQIDALRAKVSEVIDDDRPLAPIVPNWGPLPGGGGTGDYVPPYTNGTSDGITLDEDRPH